MNIIYIYSILSMLTKESFVAINYCLPRVKYFGLSLSLYEHFNQVDPEYHPLSDKRIKKKITKEDLDNERFISDDLKEDIILLTKCREVVFKTDDTTCTLKLYHSTENLDLLIDTLMYSLSYVCMLAPHRVKNVYMTYYLLDSKRVLDGDNLLDKEEVNGGACITHLDRCYISVWRKEEILKVSIHELIHGLSYDYTEDTSDITHHYQQKYGITSKKMNTFEGYTEIYAELIHCFLIARFYKMIHTPTDMYELFRGNVGIEYEFSRLQGTKVLSLLDKNKDMNKETNVCAYYLIKLELYNDLDGFLRFCLANNNGFIKMVNVPKYLDYLKGVNKLIKKNNKVTNTYLKKTTRMTCLELELFRP